MSFIMLINFYIYVKKYLKLWLLNITYCLGILLVFLFGGLGYLSLWFFNGILKYLGGEPIQTFPEFVASLERVEQDVELDTLPQDSITPALAPAPSVVDSRKFPAPYSHKFQADINTPPV
ncbi:hypothetical protein JR316_0005161 [Psilocybe cubensis]|uniref:Uncharacterized protein n=2 Tax=Psilocybe cubensis TaxID=181762 RepID=A0ACB8H5B8_PSICU|nr:hypothetical protein JR316_0005161 [Psilocybe cubensis]KAH9483061.1 hypothetical protein JR316_0005161 [Psilocybe cubensis]